MAILGKVRREIVVKHHVFRTSLVDFDILEAAEDRAEDNVELAVRKPNGYQFVSKAPKS